MWSGMMQSVHKGEHPGKSSVTFLPMIDMDPGDMSCIYSTLLFVSDKASAHNVAPVVTFGQPLWWKAVTIISCEREDSDLRSIVLRSGAFHMQMSFLGCIGYLMHESGLKETLETIYTPTAVTHMLSGKAVSRAVRGHFIVDSALNALLISKAFSIKNLEQEQFSDLALPDNDAQEDPQNARQDNCDSVNDEAANTDMVDEQILSSHEDDTCSQENPPVHHATAAFNEDFSLQHLKEGIDIYGKLIAGEVMPENLYEIDVIDSIAKRLNDVSKLMKSSRTSTVWLQYMKMLDILRQFIKAERMENWQLHLKSTYEMLPYFAASGHNLYTKSAYIYLQIMCKIEEMHPEIYEAFMRGHHVSRRSDRFWAGLSTDLVIEQVLMRSVKTTGGLTRGRSMGEMQRASWLLSMPACAEMNVAMQDLTEINYKTSEQHKEMSTARLK